MAKALKTSNYADNILKRHFDEYGPGYVLETDITYLFYGQKRSKAYLSVVKDGFTKQILSYVLSSSLEENFVLETINQLFENHKHNIHTDALIHSDQGAHYTSVMFIDLLKDLEIRQSMSRRGNCLDNAPQESFFGHMKDEVDKYINAASTYDELKEVSDKIVKEMTARTDVINIHSSIENNAPIITLKIDPVMAKAYGLTASSIGTTINQMLSGIDATTLKIDGEDITVTVEYPEGEYETVDNIKDIILTGTNGQKVALTDVANVVFEDSPASISRTDGAYEITISADYTGDNVQQQINSEVITPNLSGTISIGQNSRDRMMKSEFSSLYRAIAIAVFLVFVVMAAQFESVKFSIMVMTTIPFSLVGSFGLLKLTGVSISMTSLLGFLILVGTVVNNRYLFRQIIL